MIRNIDAQELVNTKQFVKEPVDDICSLIANNPASKIILNGGRGSGKSVVLYNLEQVNLGLKSLTINTNFDSIPSFSVEPSALFDESFFRHYYELNLSWKLLNYIQSNYDDIYNKYFSDIAFELSCLSNELSMKIHNFSYNKLRFKKLLNTKEIVVEIINRLKNILEVDTIYLTIDRFDWINGGSEFIQKLFSEYFDLFAKVIITSDDISIDNEDKRKDLFNKGYNVVTANYGKNISYVKSIIKRRLLLYKNDTSSNVFIDLDLITDEICDDLIRKTKGNISIMLYTLNDGIDMWLYHNQKLSLDYLFKREVYIQLGLEKKKMSFTHKLHL